MADKKDFANTNAVQSDSKKIKNYGLTDKQSAEIKHLFENIYISNKWRVIRMNFLRGLAFGFGAFIGGTIVVAIAIWVLMQTVDIFPWAHDFTERLIDALQD